MKYVLQNVRMYERRMRNINTLLSIPAFLIANVFANVTVFIAVECFIKIFASGRSLSGIYVVGLIVSIFVVIFVWIIDKKIKNKYSLGPKFGMKKISALDGITFVWWMPASLIPSYFLANHFIWYFDIDVFKTSFGPIMMLYISYVVLELRKYYILSNADMT